MGRRFTQGTRPKEEAMRMTRFPVLSAGAVAVGLLLLSPTRAVAQGSETVSPCCAKVCNADGSSTRCKPLLLGGLGSAPMDAVGHGCLDAETAPPGDVCVGGAFIGGSPQGLTSCICIFGGEGNPGQCASGVDGSTLTPSQCTVASIAGCGSNVEVIPKDPDCGCEVCNNDGTCDATKGENCSNCPDCACTGSDTCQDGVCKPICNNNGTCDTAAGENCSNCPDCACTGSDTCQNGTCVPPPTGCCQANEHHCFVCGDSRCGDAPCLASGTCSIASTGGVCTVCNNNGTCDAAAGENCSNCPDCACAGGEICQNGVCANPCGDGVCDTGAGENCATCTIDCSCT